MLKANLTASGFKAALRSSRFPVELGERSSEVYFRAFSFVTGQSLKLKCEWIGFQTDVLSVADYQSLISLTLNVNIFQKHFQSGIFVFIFLQHRRPKPLEAVKYAGDIEDSFNDELALHLKVSGIFGFQLVLNPAHH